MLRPYCKQARANTRTYIMDGFTPENYTDKPPQKFSEVARFIIDVFHAEKPAIGAYANKSEQELFFDWCQGLPDVLDTCYYYNRSAVDDLAEILEETEEEKAQFTERQAEERLTHMIYMELRRGVK